MVGWLPPGAKSQASEVPIFPEEGGANAGGRTTDLAGSWEHDSSLHAFC